MKEKLTKKSLRKPINSVFDINRQSNSTILDSTYSYIAIQSSQDKKFCKCFIPTGLVVLKELVSRKKNIAENNRLSYSLFC